MPLLLKLQDNRTGLFHSKTGGMFQCTVCTVSWGWQLAKNCLSIYYSPMGLRNASPAGHQSQVIMGCPLGSRCKHPGHQICVKGPLQKILVLWGVAEGECPDSARPLSSPANLLNKGFIHISHNFTHLKYTIHWFL